MLALYVCLACALTGQFHARTPSSLAVALTALESVDSLARFLAWFYSPLCFLAVPFRMFCFSCSPLFSPFTTALGESFSYLDRTRPRTGQAQDI